MQHVAILLLLALNLISCAEELRSEQAPSFFDCAKQDAVGYTKGAPFSISVVKVDGTLVERQTANAYLAMNRAALEEGITFSISSGFRTNSEQEYYNCYIDCNCNSCNFALPPGYSEHQSGHALDIDLSSNGALAWLNVHALAFGFKRTIASESWHWEWWGEVAVDGPCK